MRCIQLFDILIFFRLKLRGLSQKELVLSMQMRAGSIVVAVVRDRIIALVVLKEGMVVDMVEVMVAMAAMVAAVAVAAMVAMETLEEVMVEVVQDISLDMVMDLGIVDLCMGQLDTEALAIVLLVAMVVLLDMLAVEDMQAVMMVAGLVGLEALHLSMLKVTTPGAALVVLKHMVMVVLQVEGFIPTGIENFLTSLILQLVRLRCKIIAAEFVFFVVDDSVRFNLLIF